MKKIKIITGLSTIAFAMTAVPVVATSCSKSEKGITFLWDADTIKESINPVLKIGSVDDIEVLAVPEGIPYDESLYMTGMMSKWLSYSVTSSDPASLRITDIWKDYNINWYVGYWCPESVKEGTIVTLEFQGELSDPTNTIYKGSQKIDVKLQKHNYSLASDLEIGTSINPKVLVKDFGVWIENDDDVVIKSAKSISFDEKIIKKVEYDDSNRMFVATKQSNIPAGVTTDINVEFEIEFIEDGETVTKKIGYTFAYETE